MRACWGGGARPRRALEEERLGRHLLAGGQLGVRDGIEHEGLALVVQAEHRDDRAAPPDRLRLPEAVGALGMVLRLPVLLGDDLLPRTGIEPVQKVAGELDLPATLGDVRQELDVHDPVVRVPGEGIDVEQLLVPTTVEVERMLQPAVLHLERDVLLAQLLVVGQQALQDALLRLVEVELSSQPALEVVQICAHPPLARLLVREP